LIASGVRGIVSQRLVRCVCPHCRTEYTPSYEELANLGLPNNPATRFYRGMGCPLCFNTGYRGRTGVFEFLMLDHDLRSRITGGATREALQQAIESSGRHRAMYQSAQQLVLEGITTFDEARKVMTEIE
ncbi:MAG: type II secretion system protein GspE, partial [Raoultibacter sp.]